VGEIYGRRLGRRREARARRNDWQAEDEARSPRPPHLRSSASLAPSCRVVQTAPSQRQFAEGRGEGTRPAPPLQGVGRGDIRHEADLGLGEPKSKGRALGLPPAGRHPDQGHHGPCPNYQGARSLPRHRQRQGHGHAPQEGSEHAFQGVRPRGLDPGRSRKGSSCGSSSGGLQSRPSRASRPL